MQWHTNASLTRRLGVIGSGAGRAGAVSPQQPYHKMQGRFDGSRVR